MSEQTNKAQIRSQLYDLGQTVQVADLNRQVWWTYKEKEWRSKYIDVMQDYSLFFQTSIHANFVAMLVALYRLYETRADTVNIPGLIKLLKDSNAVSEDVIDKVDGMFHKTKDLWVKVTILRNEAFGHRSKKFSVMEVFERSGVAPDELEELILKTRELLNEISYDLERSTLPSELGADADTMKLLDDLNELKGIRSNRGS